jgi:hypothetical protein
MLSSCPPPPPVCKIKIRLANATVLFCGSSWRAFPGSVPFISRMIFSIAPAGWPILAISVRNLTLREIQAFWPKSRNATPPQRLSPLLLMNFAKVLLFRIFSPGKHLSRNLTYSAYNIPICTLYCIFVLCPILWICIRNYWSGSGLKTGISLCS